jgi:hypothetical protein
MLQRSGAAEIIGNEHIYLTVEEGVQDFAPKLTTK